MLKNWWFTTSSGGVKVPSGIIVPFMDVVANIPSGWSSFDASDRALMGNTTSSGSTGGGTGVSRGTSNLGAHTGTAVAQFCTTSSTAPINVDKILTTNAGAHAHSVTVYYVPSRSYQVMMKADTEHDKFPVNTGLLSTSAISGCSDVTPTGRLLYGSSGETSNSDLSKSTGNTSSAGAHAHNSGVAGQTAAGNRYQYTYTQGAHTHTAGAPTVTDSIKRFYLGLWSSASSEIESQDGMYALWESSTPPEGWVICDGNNGTLDLTDYFIGFDSGANIGTQDGDGTITTSGSINSAGSHNHIGSYIYGLSVQNGYHSNYGAHTHSYGASSSAFQPQYYTIIFIKYTG